MLPLYSNTVSTSQDRNLRDNDKSSEYYDDNGGKRSNDKETDEGISF